MRFDAEYDYQREARGFDKGEGRGFGVGEMAATGEVCAYRVRAEAVKDWQGVGVDEAIPSWCTSFRCGAATWIVVTAMSTTTCRSLYRWRR